MPYRKLPNTDLARIAALQKVISKEGFKEDGKLVLSYQTIRDAQQMLSKFRSTQRQYQQYYDMFVSATKDCKDSAAKARMYVRHFVTVLSLAVEREEFRADILAGYGLDPENFAMPKLLKEQDLYEWGRKIIDGEEQRIQHGGVPLYNPNIAKVKVHYSIFAEHYYSRTNYKDNAEKYRQELLQMRPLVDDLLLDIWSQVESFYTNLPFGIFLEKCKAFGIVFYLRDTEKRQAEADKLQSVIEF